jgi:RNA polymerase sigma factor (sigma-70 family)
MSTVANTVRRAADRDERAWKDLVQRYERLLKAVARQYDIASGDRDDAVQMTWLALLQNVHKMREPDKVAAWLVTATRRNCLRILRRGRHEQLSADCAEDVGTDDWDAVDDLLVRTARDRVLWECVDHLPPRQRDLVYALFTGELSYDDVAKTMSIPVGAIGPTRKRALHRLHAMLSDTTGGPP